MAVPEPQVTNAGTFFRGQPVTEGGPGMAFQPFPAGPYGQQPQLPTRGGPSMANRPAPPPKKPSFWRGLFRA